MLFHNGNVNTMKQSIEEQLQNIKLTIQLQLKLSSDNCVCITTWFAGKFGSQIISPKFNGHDAN